MSIAQNFPEIKPSLNLDFANVKKLDPRITFSRASTARAYDGVTTAKAEENLLTYSQAFNETVWGKVGSSATTDAEVAPDGTTTAETITANGVSTTHYVSQSFTAGATTKVLSVFAKAGTNDFVQFWSSSDSNAYVNFDLSAGTVGTEGSSFTGSIVDAGGGWYRCIAVTSSATANSFAIAIVSSDSAARNETNALATTIYIWGAQLEQRSSVTAYTPTTTQPITNYIPVLQTAAANTARFDHDPVTGESLGLLVEEQRTNLFTYSEQFDNAAWTKSDVTVSANQVVAPDGALAGDKFIPNTSNAVHRAFIGLLGSAGANTVSAYMKKGEYTWGVLRIEGVNSFFNLDLGTVGTVGAGNTATITHVGNGWYRCTTTRTIAGSTISTIGVASADNTDTFTGDGYSGIYIWGAQLEAGAFPTSYIPTSASQVTRSADAASMTGTNFSEWYRQDEGTLYGEATPVSASTRYLALLFDGTASNRIGLAWVISSLQQVAVANGTTQSNLISVTTPLYASLKAATSYATNDFSLAVNGGSVLSDTSGVVPNNVNQMQIGAYTSNSFSWSGHIRKISYYPQALSATQLQALTGS